jgi:hypothetical protein
MLEATDALAKKLDAMNNFRQIWQDALGSRLAAFYPKDEMPSLSDLHGGVKEGCGP